MCFAGLDAFDGRSPYGERGLKYLDALDGAVDGLSLSLRRAWIEMSSPAAAWKTSSGSLSLRRAWIEIADSHTAYRAGLGSLSLRRAWIEIVICVPPADMSEVALLTESVD